MDRIEDLEADSARLRASAEVFATENANLKASNADLTKRSRAGSKPITHLRLRGCFENLCQACSSSSNAFASFRSRVSNPSVNQP